MFLLWVLVGVVLGMFLKDLILGAIFKAYDWVKGKL